MAYKGHIDKLRFFRNGFNLIHCSLVGKDRVNIVDVLPLPFDYEIQEQTSENNPEWFAEQYKLLQASGALGAVKNLA